MSMQFVVHHLDALLAVYGYWAVLIFVTIESTGIPFPGETMLITAGIYAGSTHRLSIWLVIAAAATGAILGDSFGYFVGREGGYRLLRRHGHHLRLDERKLKLGQYLFMKHGGKVVFFGRFVSVLRTWAAFLAGMDRMEYRRFLAFNAAGGILWASLYGIGSSVLGSNIQKFAGPVGIGTSVAAGVVIVTCLIFLWRNARRLEDEAVRALPGPLDEYQGVRGEQKRRELRQRTRQRATLMS
jgi:membrane protein DedA with SNARE-associated domain